MTVTFRERPGFEVQDKHEVADHLTTKIDDDLGIREYAASPRPAHEIRVVKSWHGQPANRHVTVEHWHNGRHICTAHVHRLGQITGM
ncbi:hypothetical protein SAMN05443575_4084 [Jatrophihabitans endophyticus]|uniref:Uncharacterized protein n=1 Tax=Jatrophihabitans endophyticus TaxID=1206085 RepID=A0A1M5TYR9_9ACTN|nr:hypothetical protein [Jatrophihabitans endophyticus]SHH55975.1 hypothetical protein SAMN05443575_4084 [Jatrophihabitans endophyticus]